MPDEPPRTIQPTTRLYWHDDHCFSAEARIVGAQASELAFDGSCFYPGGGGQPPDEGTVTLADGQVLAVSSIRADASDTFWHVLNSAAPPGIVGQQAKLELNRERRLALMRHHTVLHVLNTIALRDYAGWITGVQIGAEYSRIDFKLEGFSAAMCGELETKVNGVLNVDHPLRSYYLAENEFHRREDLLRTLEVKPPVVDGRVRVVEIDGFDAQACGGTHVGSTVEVGKLSIFRTENKGRINKRLYIRLD